jgi:two-component system cell cycle sensor histidine kinase PleC
MFSSEQDTDPRVLKIQLDIIAGVGRAAWISTPLWTLVLAAMGSDALGWFGRQSWSIAAIFPLVVTGVCWTAYRMFAVYRADPAPDLPRWVRHFTLAQLAISAAWGTMPWLLWDPGNLPNHLFILLAITMAGASVIIRRASSVRMIVVGTLPLLLMATPRFLSGDLPVDIVIGLLGPLYALHIFADGRRLIGRLHEDVRLRLKVEDMAGALAAARDDALVKRHEAESANAAKSAFLANMSHELRTPLNAILGFSEIIGSQAMGPNAMARYSEYANDIHSSGTHLLSLINDLLDVAKIEAGKMEIDPKPVDPRPVMEGIARLMANRIAAKQVEFSIATAPELPLLVADERALKQMLLNLVSNAVKFTPPGGHVSLTCGSTRRGGMEFCVDDDGPGISPEKLERIFQPFNQINNRFDREAGGTGLGLALVQGLVQLHGGRAWLESEPGIGTKAFLYFPSTIAAASRRESA